MLNYLSIAVFQKRVKTWWFFLFYVLVFKIFLCCWCLMYVFIFLVKVTEWPPIGKIAAHSAYEMFSWYKYLIVSLVFSHLGFWSGNLFLIAPFPDLCLLVPNPSLTKASCVHKYMNTMSSTKFHHLLCNINILGEVLVLSF